MPQMNMIQALNSAQDIMLGRDPHVVIIGEDIGYFGGVFRTTDGLQRKYGEHRVIDAPIAEAYDAQLCQQRDTFCCSRRSAAPRIASLADDIADAVVDQLLNARRSRSLSSVEIGRDSTSRCSAIAADDASHELNARRSPRERIVDIRRRRPSSV